MGRIGRLLSFVRGQRHGAKLSDVKFDPGGGANRTGEHFSAPGDDSVPLPGDWLAVLPVGRRTVAVGYIDPKSAQEAGPGDKRIYARDPSTGAATVSAWLKSDGSAIIANSAGTFELQPSGAFVINGVTITPTGDVITATGVSLNGHPHTQGDDSGGDSQQPTAPPTPTEV